MWVVCECVSLKEFTCVYVCAHVYKYISKYKVQMNLIVLLETCACIKCGI